MVERILKQLKSRNTREKQSVPKTKRMVFERVKHILYETKSAPILLGLRRVGKTTIFRQLLLEDEKSFLIPFDDLSIRVISELELSELFETLYNEGYRTFLIDEVQEITDWDKKIFGLINSFQNCKFAITGSSSLNISKKETGLDRTTIVDISTLTFDEYLILRGKGRNSFNNTEDLKKYFEGFLGIGGFPDYVKEENFMETIYRMREDILKDLIDNDITRTFPNVKSNILNELILRIARLTNGELNKTSLIKDIDRFTQRELDDYLDVLQKSKLIKIIYKIKPDGTKMMRPKIKVYLNPHIHIWLLERPFKDLDTKFKGHLIESYWLTWIDSVNKATKLHYYIKDNKNQEIDFASINPDGSFKTLHEFKYSHNTKMNELFEKTQAKRKIIWCLEDKEDEKYKYISILNSQDDEGSKY